MINKKIVILLLTVGVIISLLIYYRFTLNPLKIDGFTIGENVMLISLVNEGRFDLQITEVFIDRGELLNTELVVSERGIVLGAEPLKVDSDTFKAFPISQVQVIPHDQQSRFYGLRLRSTEDIVNVVIKYNYLGFSFERVLQKETWPEGESMDINKEDYMKNIAFLALIFIPILSLVSCSPEKGATGMKEEKVNWEARSEYKKNEKVLLTVYPEPTLVAGKSSGYIFHFTEPFETFKGKELAIYATHKETGEKISVVEPLKVEESSPGYSSLQRFTANFEIPEKGLWRYEVFLDKEFYADVVFLVTDEQENSN